MLSGIRDSIIRLSLSLISRGMKCGLLLNSRNRERTRNRERDKSEYEYTVYLIFYNRIDV